MLEAVEHMDMSLASYSESNIIAADILDALEFESASNPSPKLQLRRLKILRQADLENSVTSIRILTPSFFTLFRNMFFFTCTVFPMSV